MITIPLRLADDVRDVAEAVREACTHPYPKPVSGEPAVGCDACDETASHLERAAQTLDDLDRANTKETPR